VISNTHWKFTPDDDSVACGADPRQAGYYTIGNEWFFWNATDRCQGCVDAIQRKNSNEVTHMAENDVRVDWSNDRRSAVVGGECARCFHRPPLHEPGCVLLDCRAPAACGCRQCFSKQPRFMRFVVRPDCKGGIMGINHGLFREGVVYEVTEMLGEHVIRELGPSPLAVPAKEAMGRFGFSNAWTYNQLYTERAGGVVRTVAEHEAPRTVRPEVVAAARAAPRGTKVRVAFGDETSWAEHIEGDIYRSLNTTLSNVTLKLPEGHEHADKNGQPCNMKWGHLFEAEVVREGVVRPLFIIGLDTTPREEIPTLAEMAKMVVEGGATGIKTSSLERPITIGKMEVTGPGSVGIDLDEEDKDD
jgi:hypothetical protein